MSVEIWLNKTKNSPELHTNTVRTGLLVDPVADANAWQGVAFRKRREPLEEIAVAPGQVIYADFGTHLVGTVSFRVETPSRNCDAPVKLGLRFAELPYEAASVRPYRGGLCASWVPDEVVYSDDPPETVTLPRRHAFRYLRIEVIAAVAPVRFSELECRAVTSAEREVKPLCKMDEIGLRTLRNCMQKVLEDGPKRDRRLWLGDLRLEALVNGVTYRDYRIVERSLYLLASCSDETGGMIPAAVFDRNPVTVSCCILDYSLLLPSVLLEHLEFYGREEIVRDLFPLAERQIEIASRFFDGDGTFHDPGNLWLFIDHSPELIRDSAETCVYLLALRRISELAKRLNLPLSRDGKAEWKKIADRLRETSFNAEKGVIETGEKRQISWASQAWAILAGVLSAEEGKIALRYLSEHDDTLRPRTPYLWHYVLEACHACGDTARADSLMNAYWGAMAELGADTYWEAFFPEDPFFSPYGDVLANSACHAWSCSPSYFLRKK